VGKKFNQLLCDKDIKIEDDFTLKDCINKNKKILLYKLWVILKFIYLYSI
jgi:hypothetical protein